MKEQHKQMLKTLLDEGALNEIFTTVKEQYYKEHYNTDPKEVAKREQLFAAIKGLDKVTFTIKQTIQAN